MTSQYSLADVAALIGEPTRAAMLLALLDGRALSATELARAANLSAPATSLHLAKLTQGELLAVQKTGRHRYYRLANANVVHALEALGVIATAPPPPRSLSAAQGALRVARTCYDHLAGALGVTLTEKFERARILHARDDYTYDVTDHGERWFAEAMRIDVSALLHQRRPLAKRCLDWTERRPHIAGSLGAAILGSFLERRWIARTSGSRAVRVTDRGRIAIAGFG